MPLAITAEQLELGTIVDQFIDRFEVRASARKQLDRSAEGIPNYWKALASAGLLAVHLPDEYGGSDGGLIDLAIVVERFGYAVAAGPLLASAVTSAIIAHEGSDQLKAQLLPGLGTGELIGATGLDGSFTVGDDFVDGHAEAVMSAHLADVLLLGAGDSVLVVRAGTSGVSVEADPSLDPTRRVATVRLAAVSRAAVIELAGARPSAAAIARLLVAADAAGGASRATDSATEYAKTRKQFGQFIGSFQAVKHHCVDMFIAQERATAAVWDGCRASDDGADQFALATAVAALEATSAFLANAKLNVQVHGGIGFTWEHDAHILLRRALTGPCLESEALASGLVEAARTGLTRTMTVRLENDAERRAGIRADAERLADLACDEQRRALVESGYLQPHWPTPWGRGADAVEQLIIDEEFVRAGIRRPDLGVGTWIIATLIQHGSDRQVEDWVRPALLGNIVWCQLFSEPDAGSDAAAVRTKATRTEGGWLLSGQKVWTSNAHHSDFGLATVRTNPELPKHAGISTMVVDLSAEGVVVRPLREATGDTNFNEVFLDSVFVPDAHVVGAVDGGWKVVRSALGNERVSIGSGSANPLSIDPVARYLHDPGSRRVEASEIARYIVQDNVIRAINHRRVLRAISGAAAGAEGNVTKLLTAAHVQQAAEMMVRMDPIAAASARDEGARIGHAAIFSRAYSIGGGTTEITKNQIGERILGLPREDHSSGR